MSNRILVIDIAKGITIIMMVLGHSSLPHWLSNWIWSFHMPFFFFVSGLTTSWGKNKNFFIRSKTQTLISPFIVYSIINLLILTFCRRDAYSSFIIYATNILKDGWGGIALWFIPVLWISLLVSKIIIDIKRNGIKYIALIIFSIIGCYLCFEQIILPWALSTVPIAIVYVLVGSLFKDKINDLQNIPIGKNCLMIIIGSIITLVISHYFRLDLAVNQILPFIPLLIASLAGIALVIAISILLLRIKLFSFLIQIGRNTYEIMALSQCLIVFLNLYIKEYVILKYLIMALIVGVITVIKRKYKLVKNAYICNSYRS